MTKGGQGGGGQFGGGGGQGGIHLTQAAALITATLNIYSTSLSFFTQLVWHMAKQPQVQSEIHACLLKRHDDSPSCFKLRMVSSKGLLRISAVCEGCMAIISCSEYNR